MIGTTQLINTFSGITPSDHFKTKLYTGNGSTQNITGLAFAPDMVWIKARSIGYSHSLQDTLRGPGTSTSLYPELNVAQGTYGGYGQISAFGTGGFTVASGGHGTYPVAQVNQNGVTYASWNWKAGGTAVTNNEGAVTSQVSANTAAGFSIVKYTGNSTSGATVGHSLDSSPEIIVVKNLDANSTNWIVKIPSVMTDDRNYLYLNDSSAVGTAGSTTFIRTVNSSIFTLGSSGQTNSTDDFIAYCWHSVAGFSKIGSYSGGSSGSSNVITVGFKPSFLMVKRTDQDGDAWQLFDIVRGGSDTFDNYLQASNASAEASYSAREVTFANDGFYWTNAESGTNISGGTYIYMAFA